MAIKDWNGFKKGSDTYIPNDATARTDIAAIEEKIPSGASSSNKFATASDISAINDKIPVNASSSNQLVTKADVASAYHAAGSKTCAELTSSLLIAANEGCVYNMSDSGTTTADFVEGADKPINIGDDIVVVDAGSGVYKFNKHAGFIDTSGLQPKTLDTPITTYDGVVQRTVEACLGAFNTFLSWFKGLIPTGASNTNQLVTNILLNNSLAEKADANLVPDGASTSNKLATASDVNAKQNDLGLYIDEEGYLCQD